MVVNDITWCCSIIGVISVAPRAFQRLLVPGAGFEPASCVATGFKPAASTDFATRVRLFNVLVAAVRRHSRRQPLLIDRVGTDLSWGGADFETFPAIEQCRGAGKGTGNLANCSVVSSSPR